MRNTPSVSALHLVRNRRVATWVALLACPLSVPAAAQEWHEASRQNAPKASEAFTAVWTGSELIVWGGLTGDDYLSSGARYDPKADRWRPTAEHGAPSARAWHTAVWTGNVMIVWGGDDSNDALATGAAYDPGADAWRPLTKDGAPAERGSHVAVWTGTEMIVWAGVTERNSFASGGRYDPKSGRWKQIRCGIKQAMPRTTTAVWTGQEMMVWGGINGGRVLGHGVRYDPAKDEWRSMSSDGAPAARAGHIAAWTGTELVVWGGRDRISGGTALADGARYDPATDRWSPMPSKGLSMARDEAAWAWTGRELCVLGGRANQPPEEQRDGGCYDPASGRWRPLRAPDEATVAFCAWNKTGLITCGTRKAGPRMRAWRCAWPARSDPPSRRN